MTTVAPVSHLNDKLLDAEPDTYCWEEMVERDLLTRDAFTPDYRAWLDRAEVKL